MKRIAKREKIMINSKTLKLKLISLSLIFLFGCSSLNFSRKSSSLRNAKNTDIEEIMTSSEKGTSTAKKAFDGDDDTRWESVQNVDPSWIAFKLKPDTLLKSLRIKWETAAALEYEIQVSDNAREWETVFAVYDGQEAEERSIRFPEVETSYVRIFCTSRTTEWGYSIFEVEINPVVLMPEDKIYISQATASTESDAGGPWSTIDGDFSTRWESAHGIDPQWLVLEFENEEQVGIVKIVWETAAAKKYNIQVSKNKKTWKTVAKITDGIEAEERTIAFHPINAKYLRVLGKSRLTDWGYSIYEIEAYR